MSEAKENPRCAVHHYMEPDGGCTCPHECQNCGVTYVGGHSKDECVTVLKRRLRLNELAAKIEALSVGREPMSREDLIAAAKADVRAQLSMTAYDVLRRYATEGIATGTIYSDANCINKIGDNWDAVRAKLSVPSAPAAEEDEYEKCERCAGTGMTTNFQGCGYCVAGTRRLEPRRNAKPVAPAEALPPLDETSEESMESQEWMNSFDYNGKERDPLWGGLTQWGISEQLKRHLLVRERQLAVSQAENKALKHTVADLSGKIAKLCFETQVPAERSRKAARELLSFLDISFPRGRAYANSLEETMAICIEQNMKGIHRS